MLNDIDNTECMEDELVPDVEEDEPIDSANGDLKNTEEELGVVQAPLDTLIKENDKNRRDKKYFKAFGMIKLCIYSILFLCVFDYIMFAITHKNDANVSNAMEILKALVFSLSGYLFAERKNNT